MGGAWDGVYFRRIWRDYWPDRDTASTWGALRRCWGSAQPQMEQSSRPRRSEGSWRKGGMTTRGWRIRQCRTEEAAGGARVVSACDGGRVAARAAPAARNGHRAARKDVQRPRGHDGLREGALRSGEVGVRSPGQAKVLRHGALDRQGVGADGRLHGAVRGAQGPGLLREHDGRPRAVCIRRVGREECATTARVVARREPSEPGLSALGRGVGRGAMPKLSEVAG
eukprot:2484422-Rhodomonas_salina.1